ncbi:MAG: glycosyltransferase family 4 protein [Patescibacteria group bacterium]
MRVVHISCVAPPETGGIGQAALLETTSLIERGIDAALIAPASSGLVSASSVRRLPVTGRFGNAAFLRRAPLARALKDADIVHLHYPFYGTAGFVAALRRRNKIKRLVVTLHMDATAPGWKGSIFNLHRLFLQKRILEAADELIVSSKDYAQHSSFASVVAERPHEVLELPFGVDEARFSPGPNARERFGIPRDAKVVLFVGGMDEAHAFKGVDVLLHAMVNVPNAWCVLVGDGELRDGHEKLAQGLGISSRAKFLGRVDAADLPDAYRMADVLAFPSISGAEAFGLVALEAQACGIPVVASQLPGVRTVVEDGVTGLLVPPTDAEALASALRSILSDDVRRAQMGETARTRVLLRFTNKAHMDGLVALYQKLCVSPS